MSLQQQQQQQRQDQRPAEKKPLYHYKEGINASEKPAWAKEVGESEERGDACLHPQGWARGSVRNTYGRLRSAGLASSRCH